MLVQEPLIGLLDALDEVDAGLPAHAGEGGGVEQLARGAVGLGGIEDEPAAVAHDRGDQPGELGDGEVPAPADIDLLLAAVMAQQEQAGIGQIVDMQELAPWRAGAPDRHRGAAVFYGFMEPAD